MMDWQSVYAGLNPYYGSNSSQVSVSVQIKEILALRGL